MQAGQFVETFHNINLLNLFGQVANEACRAGLSFPMILVMVSPSKELVYATEIGRHEGELRQRPLCGNLVPPCDETWMPIALYLTDRDLNAYKTKVRGYGATAPS